MDVMIPTDVLTDSSCDEKDEDKRSSDPEGAIEVGVPVQDIQERGPRIQG